MTQKQIKNLLEYLSEEEVKELIIKDNKKIKKNKYPNGTKSILLNIDKVDYDNLTYYLKQKNITISYFLNDRIKGFISKQYWNNQKQRETISRQEEERITNEQKYNFNLKIEEL